MRLCDLGDLRTGYQMRGAVDITPEGLDRVVMVGDVLDHGIAWDKVVRTSLSRVAMKDFLAANDIVIRSRGAHYGVTLITDPPGRTVAVAPLYILSVRRTDVLPAYVAWFLNRPASRKALAALARGTSLPTISIRDLGELELPVPPMEAQRLVAAVADLGHRELELCKQLNDKRQRLAGALFDRNMTRRGAENE